VYESLLLTARAIAALPRDRRAVVAIDGLDGAGKSTFADALGGLVKRPVVRASVDDFHNPRAVRYNLGRESPDGFHLDSFDFASLVDILLAPFVAGRPFGRQAFDHERDAPIKSTREHVADDALLILDGMFLHREALRNWWDLSVWLDVPPAVAAARLLARDGRPTRRRYVRGNELYAAAVGPRLHASLTVAW
jgi:uridine kinase